LPSKKRSAAYDYPEPIKAALVAAEEEREHRDKLRVKHCPICGLRPEIPFDKGGRHIYSGHCEKCQTRFTIWITD
jgi:hypothetical protein